MPNDYLDGFILGETTYDMKDPNLTERVNAVEEAMENKAEIDGYYQQMTVGNAEQVVSTVGIEDQVPYQFRTSGGSADIGDRENDKIIGGTVAWNQKVDPPLAGTTTSAGVTFTYDGNGRVTCSGEFTDAWAYAIISKTSFSFIKSHKYFLCGCPVGGSESFLRIWVGSVSAFPVGHRLFDDGRGKILDALEDETGVRADIMINSSYAGDISQLVFTPQLFDLTQMFGSTIADYIYSLEQSTAGAGVAWFRKLFPKPYYTYNPGELLSVEGLQSHDMTGFNQWDEQWEVGGLYNASGLPWTTSDRIRSKNYIPVIADTLYYANKPLNACCWYDADFHFIIGSSQYLTTFRAPTNARYMKFAMGAAYGTTYKNDICINLHWDGERDGEYEPYKKLSYPLDSSLTLRGIPKLDSNNKLYYDGDTYEPDGTVTRRYGIVDLGTLTWMQGSTNTTGASRWYAQVENNDIKKPANAEVLSNLVCSKYLSKTGLETYQCVQGVSIGQNDGKIYLYDDALKTSTSQQVATALDNVYLVYELATPTAETAEPFSDPQIVNDWGTEEYVTDSIVPVGHKTNYQPNLRAKLEMAPDSPEGDGDYIVRQSNGENTYVPLVIPAELPTAPTTDGTYKLQVTVANGTATLAWVSA